MVNNDTNTLTPTPLRTLSTAVTAYVALAAATVVALAVLSWTGLGTTTDDAWVHAVVVAGFAVLLPLRLRSARRGSGSALRAVGVIAGVLLVVNLVEAAIPGLFPDWMRVEMVLIAALMAATMALVVRARR